MLFVHDKLSFSIATNHLILFLDLNFNLFINFGIYLLILFYI